MSISTRPRHRGSVPGLSPLFEDLLPPAVRVMSMAVWNGELYAALNDSGGVARYEGGRSWRNIGLHALQNYSLAVYRGELVSGTFDTGEVFAYPPDGPWYPLGRLGEEDEVMALTTYHGELLGGTLPHGQVYRHRAEKNWELVGELGRDGATSALGTRTHNYEDGEMRRVWNFSVYDGRLFAGTFPSGRVYSTKLGQAVSENRALRAGWHYLVAQRRGRFIELYRDGLLVGAEEGLPPCNGARSPGFRSSPLL